MSAARQFSLCSALSVDGLDNVGLSFKCLHRVEYNQFFGLENWYRACRTYTDNGYDNTLLIVALKSNKKTPAPAHNPRRTRRIPSASPTCVKRRPCTLDLRQKLLPIARASLQVC